MLRGILGSAGGPPVGGSGTTNTIPRWTGPTTLGNSGLIDDGTQIYTTTRNIGIGTASPAARLHSVVADGSYQLAVSGTTRGARFETNATETRLVGVDNTLSASFQPLSIGGSTVIVRTNGTTQAAIFDASGNVGIGMTSGFPAKLGVLSANAIGTADLTFSYDATGSYRHGFSNVFSSGTAANNTSTWLVWNAAGGQAQVMTANGAGNVGVGTSSPISPLHVKGNATNTEGTLSLTPNTGGRTWQVISQQTSSIFRIYDQSLPADRLLIDSLGNIYGTSGTTSMTGGFFYIPAAAGAPTGTPTALSGRVPMYYDTTNNKFYVYNGAWKAVTLA